MSHTQTVPPEQLKSWIEERQQLHEWMTKAKARELELRTLIATAIFKREANGFFREGTSNVSTLATGASLNVKLQQPYKREILVELMPSTLEEAELDAKTADELVRKKYELSITTYRLLPPEKQVVIDKMLKVTPGTPQLEIE